MDLFMAISQGIGVALACGFRPFLGPLVIALFASADAGIDFENTGYRFLESIWLVGAMAAMTLVATVLLTRAPDRYVRIPYAVAAGTLGALEFAGSLDSDGYAPIPGIVAGAICAVLGFVALGTFIDGARQRLAARGEAGASLSLELFAYLIAIVTVAAAVLAPPVSYLPLVFCIWVLASRKQRSAKKYEGLRVLR